MNAIVLSIFAGVVGTGLGGVITAFFGSRTDKMISIFLSFAGGVMTSIVFFQLIPEAVENSDMNITIIGFIIGIIMVSAFNLIFDKISNAKSKLHESYAEFYHESDLISKQKTMIRSGILMFLVIALHDIPEGLVIGTAGIHDPDFGFRLAIMIGIHNVPEGMAISAPLISGGINKFKVIGLTFLEGIPTVVGTIVGLLLGGLSDTAVALSFSIAGGAMLYVVFGEILPQTMVLNKNRTPTIVLLIGIIVGLLLTKI